MTRKEESLLLHNNKYCTECGASQRMHTSASSYANNNNNKKVEGRIFLNWRWDQFKRNQDLVTKTQEFSVHCLISANSSQGEPTPSESGQLKKKKICNWICCTFTMMEWVFIYTSTGERKISLIVLVALELVRAHLNSPKETKDHGNN